MLMNIGDVLCQPANKQNEEISTKNDKEPRQTPLEILPPPLKKKAVLSGLSHFPVTIYQKETNLPRTRGPFKREKKRTRLT